MPETLQINPELLAALKADIQSNLKTINSESLVGTGNIALVSSVNGYSGAITNVAKTNEQQWFEGHQTFRSEDGDGTPIRLISGINGDCQIAFYRKSSSGFAETGSVIVSSDGYLKFWSPAYNAVRNIAIGDSVRIWRGRHQDGPGIANDIVTYLRDGYVNKPTHFLLFVGDEESGGYLIAHCYYHYQNFFQMDKIHAHILDCAVNNIGTISIMNKPNSNSYLRWMALAPYSIYDGGI